ncbi:MAG: hypothetical protein FJ290_28490 [Planctomycetes bacterium]|nr:hypothetical protein [Planctomycetota bacterium]
MGRRTALGLGLATALAGLTGCTTWQGGVGGFLKTRLKDMMEMADIGVTVTETAQFSFYAALLSVGPGGYGEVNGRFYGMGGGDIGAMKIQYKHVGLMAWGQEEVGWGDGLCGNFGDPDPNDPEKINKQGVGIVGIVRPPYDGRPGGRPT